MGAAEIPLLETKVHAPRRRPGVVSRPRLDQRLDRRSLPAVTLVSASAGFGKTTLLGQWLAAGGDDTTATAWLSLDRRDSDPSIFWSYVVAALQKVVPDIGEGAVAVLRSAPSSLEAAVTTLLNELAAIPEDVVLVLADYHLVESREVQESMLLLLEHLPPRLHLVVASRADPPWPLAGLRARGDLLEIRAADLRFTRDEAAAYLNDAMGLSLTAADVHALESRTEGWIAALQLAALSMQGRDDVAGFIAGFAGDDRFIVDYLVGEVLDRQSHDVRRFLLETSILNRLAAPLCAAVTGQDDTSATLDALERANLFLVPLDDRRRWYRYHHLFADVLRARLVDELPDRVAELHRRASEWLEAHGDRPEALRHAMAADDFARAAELVELSISGLRLVRQEATLRAWLEALPRDLFPARPVLSIGLVGARMAAGDTHDVEPLLAGAERWLELDAPSAGMIVHDHAEYRRLPGQAAMYRAGLALLAGDLAGTIAQGERAGALAGDDDHLGRGAAAALIGLARWAEGDLDAAHRGYTDAIAAFGAAGHLADVLGCSLGLADIQVAQGRLSAAMRTLATGLELANRNGPLRGRADMHVGLSEVHLERNDLDAAAEHLRASAELGETLALPQHAYRWRVAEARLRAANGDHAGALALLGEAEPRYATDYSPSARPVTATTARSRLAGGDVAGARRWATDAGLTADDEISYLHEYEHLTLARVLLASNQLDDAARLLPRLLVAAEAGHRRGSAIEALALQALAHQANRDTPAALAALDDALARAEPEGFVRVFLEAGTPMTALLLTAVRHGVAVEHAERLLAAAGAARPAAADAQGLVDELSSRELDVLRLLRTELSGPDIARELVVSLNTVRTHTKNIYMKLGVNSRRAAVRRAGELGL